MYAAYRELVLAMRVSTQNAFKNLVSGSLNSLSLE
jgi:hypothetical protein